MLAQECGLEAGDLVWTRRRRHVYDNHRDQIETQLSREPFPYPTLALHRRPPSIFDDASRNSGCRLRATIRRSGRRGSVRIDALSRSTRRGDRGRDCDPVAHPGGSGVLRDSTTGHPVAMGRRTWDSIPERFVHSRPSQHRRHPERPPGSETRRTCSVARRRTPARRLKGARSSSSAARRSSPWLCHRRPAGADRGLPRRRR